MSKWLDMSLTCTQLNFKNQQPASASHMNQVFEIDGHKLFLGNIRAVNDPQYLRQHQVGAVLSVIDTSDIKVEKSIIHLWIAAEDCEKVQLIKYFDQSAQFIQNHLKHTNVLVHCYAGISRSCSLILAYLMKYHGYSVKEALSKVKCQRPQADPNDGFMEQLQEYEQKLRSKKQHTCSSTNSSVSKFLSTSNSTEKKQPQIFNRQSTSNFNIYSNLNTEGIKTNIKNLQLTTFNTKIYKPSYLDKSASPGNQSTQSIKAKTFFQNNTSNEPLKKQSRISNIDALWNKSILGTKPLSNLHRKQHSINF